MKKQVPKASPDVKAGLQIEAAKPDILKKKPARKKLNSEIAREEGVAKPERDN